MRPVIQRLYEEAASFQLVLHDRTYTGIDEARALGIDADEVLKAVVVDSVDGYVLAVIPASRRLDMHLVRAAVGDHQARLASEDEIRARWPEFELGALPPLGTLLGIPMYVDPELFGHQTVVFAAGDQTRSVQIRTEGLFRHETFTVTPLTVHEEDRAVASRAGGRVPVGAAG